MAKICSSQVEYDGPDLPGIGVVRGDSLNTLARKVDKAVSILRQSNSEIYNETYPYSEIITLEHVPYKIILLAKGGFILPKEAYRLSAGKLILNTEFGFEADDSILVVYRGYLDV